VRFILGLGADPNERVTWSNVDWTPLAIGIHHADPEVVRALLDHGADPNQRWCVGIDMDVRKRIRDAKCSTDNGVTPLMFATSRGCADLSVMLRQHGASAALTDWQGRTADEYRIETTP
jgi:ankyrin repeat protein